MKLFKLIKSIDYVSYPSYKELVKISNAVSNSIDTFRDLLLSTIIGVLFDKTPLSECLLQCLAEKFPNSIAEQIAAYDNSSLILSIIIAVLAFCAIKLFYFIKARININKNTKKKRDVLVHEFYNIAIPQLIEVKSIIEQTTEDTSGDHRKKLLLLLQAKYEVCDLNRSLFEMNIIERDKTGLQTKDSHILSDRISKCAYINFLEEMLDIIEIIYKELSAISDDYLENDINDIRATINASGVFDKLKELKPKLTEIKAKINPTSSPKVE